MEALAQKIVDFTTEFQALHNTTSRLAYIKLLLKLYEISEMVNRMAFGDLLRGKDTFYAEIQRVRQCKDVFLENYVDSGCNV